jgi:glutaconate CoA-transferase, subunit B
MSATYSLAELCIAACARVWADDGEVLATGFTALPRIAAGLAKLTCNPALLITDAESLLVETPVPLGPRQASDVKAEGWMSYARTFDIIHGGKRHALLAPVQIDRYGQTNISTIGERSKPKAALLGVRGLPSNTISHPNSYFIPSHDRRAFVADEVDYVCGAGYNPARWPGGKVSPFVDLRQIITNLAVMDFQGPDRQIRVVSLHPGVTFDEVQAATSFPLARTAALPTTPSPGAEELRLIREVLDPHDLRASVFKGNPPAGSRKG